MNINEQEQKCASTYLIRLYVLFYSCLGKGYFTFEKDVTELQKEIKIEILW